MKVTNPLVLILLLLVTSFAAIAELSRRISSEPLERGGRIDSSSAVHAHFGPLLRDEKRETRNSRATPHRQL